MSDCDKCTNFWFSWWSVCMPARQSVNLFAHLSVCLFSFFLLPQSKILYSKHHSYFNVSVWLSIHLSLSLYFLHCLLPSTIKNPPSNVHPLLLFLPPCSVMVSVPLSLSPSSFQCLLTCPTLKNYSFLRWALILSFLPPCSVSILCLFVCMSIRPCVGPSIW
jgi:hypothetical protein